MQFRKSQKIAIRDGRLTRTFRTWKRPQAKTGGRYNIPPYGALEVEFVQQMKLKEIPPGHVRDAGYQTHEEVASHLGIHLEDTVWSIAFRYLGERPVNQPDRSVSTTDSISSSPRLGLKNGIECCFSSDVDTPLLPFN